MEDIWPSCWVSLCCLIPVPLHMIVGCSLSVQPSILLHTETRPPPCSQRAHCCAAAAKNKCLKWKITPDGLLELAFKPHDGSLEVFVQINFRENGFMIKKNERPDRNPDDPLSFSKSYRFRAVAVGCVKDEGGQKNV